MDEIYSNAYTEVYEIIRKMPVKYARKIPKELRSLFNNKKNNKYNFKYEEEKSLSEQEISIEAKAILSNLFRDYIVDDKVKEKILEEESKQRIEYEAKQREKYNPDNIFNKKQNKVEIIEEIKEEAMIIQKESFFTKIINKIKSIFKK